MVFFDWLLVYLSGRLNPAATALSGAGLGYQVSLSIFEREKRFAPFAHRTSQGLVGVTIALLIVIQAAFGFKNAWWLAVACRKSIHADVLFIVVDTLRADHMSLQGYDRETDPTMKRIASEGVMFENAYSASSWTLTTHASLFTGRWPYEHKADGGRDLDETYPPLPH